MADMATNASVLPDEPQNAVISTIIEPRMSRAGFFVWKLIAIFGILTVATATRLFRGTEVASFPKLLSFLSACVYPVDMYLATKRARDVNLSPWICLLLLFPILNIFLALYLLLAPGTRGANRYGEAPDRQVALKL